MAAQQQFSHTQAPLPQLQTYERLMGDTELSYYLPSRADGANDMALLVGFRGPRRLFTPRRILATWAILLLRHPTISARVIPPSSNGSPIDTDYTNVKFSYTPPTSPADALRRAASQIELRNDMSGDELTDRHMNGKRLLSDSRLVYLTISEICSNPQDEQADYAFFLTASHCTSDSGALQPLMNDFLTLIAGTDMGFGWSETDLEDLLRKEWQVRWGSATTNAANVLPPSIEEDLPLVGGKLRELAGKVDFRNMMKAQIGGHVLPRKKAARRKGLVTTAVFEDSKSDAIIKSCRNQGVSVSTALFSLAALAWSRTQRRRGVEMRTDLPLMMYTALNLRPRLLPSDCSSWRVAIGFFNVVLPSFLPSSAQQDETDSWRPLRKTHWHRARSAKAQSSRAAKPTMIVSRAREMAKHRRASAVLFAVEDDAKALGIALPPPPPTSTKPPSASAALLGFSHLGNLDAVYKHDDYPSLQLHTMTCATRMRPGAMMVFASKFAGKLRLSMAYDVNGFEDNVLEMWWADLLRGIDELLVGTPTARL